MPKSPNAIIGSFEDIGKSIVTETVKVPGDIAEKALETFGAGTTKGQTGTQQPQGGKTDGQRPKDSWDLFDARQTDQTKKAIAREALAALSGRRKPTEPSVWERLQKEEEQKKTERDAAHRASMSVLPSTGTKRPTGDLYGMKAKRSSTEIGKNVKSE